MAKVTKQTKQDLAVQHHELCRQVSALQVSCHLHLPTAVKHGPCLLTLKKKIHEEVYEETSPYLLLGARQWGAADAEIKVPSGENTDLKRSPFKTWSRSVYSHTCYAYCQGISSLLISTLPVHSPAFLPKPLPISPVLAVANTWFLCRPAE